ncbi:13895_t:CDS:2, partial [Gigaspora rosea]
PTSTKSSTTNSNTNSRSTSPELLKTTKRPTSMISVTNSQPVMPEVKVKQSSSTQPNDSSNIINKSKQLSQQIPPTQVIKKQSFSQSSRPPSPEITKLSEPPLISGKSNTSKPSRPSTPDITKSSINETTRKRSVSRPSTFEIQQLPELTRRQRSYSTTQMSFATTFNSINTNSTLNSQIQNNRRTSFTSSIASQISDDSYFQRPSTPTSETSVESNDNYKITLDDCNTFNLFSDTTNDKICLVIDKKSTEINNFMHEDINQPKNRLVVFDSEQEITPAKTCISKLNLSDNLTVIETSSLEHETDISNDKIFNNDNSILSDNDNHKNELQQGEKDNLIQENNQNIDIKGSIEILDESSKEVKTETKIDKINAVELINNMMENDKTIKNVKNVIEVNGNKLPAIIEQDLDLEHQSIEKIIINSINQHDHMVFTPTKIETEEKHNLNLTEMAMNYEKSNIVEDCAIKQQNFSNINLLGQEQISQDNHIKNNNTLNDNICVMQNNINNIYNINNQECIPYLPSEPAIIEHGTISVYADPYKKYVGSYGTTPQDFSPFTNYETQDIIMRVDEKRFDEVMRQNLLVPSEIGYKESTVTNLLKEPNLSTENLLNSIDSITKEQQYYDVSISEDESLDSKYKMKRPSYGTFPDLCSCKKIFQFYNVKSTYSNSVKSLHLGQKDEQSTFSSLCSCPIC